MALYRLESAFEWRSTQNILRVEIRKVAFHIWEKNPCNFFLTLKFQPKESGKQGTSP